MRFARFAALLMLAAPAFAVAQDASSGETPPPLAGRDLVSLGTWYSANVRVTTDWWLRSFSADGLVMISRGLKEDANGHVKADIRVEATQPQGGPAGSWRSAKVSADANCRAQLTVRRDPNAPIAPQAPPKAFDTALPTSLLPKDELPDVLVQGMPQPTNVRLMVYPGQNLTGAGRPAPFNMAGPLLMRVRPVLQSICAAAVADTYDSKRAPDGPPALKRDPGSLEIWARTNLDLKGWRDPIYQPDAINLLSDDTQKPSPGRPVRVKVRIEFIDPQMSRSITRAADSTRVFNGPDGRPIRATATDGRPIWVRSEERDYEVDCMAMSAKQLKREQFVDRGLRTSSAVAANPPAAQPINEQHMDYARLRAFCAAT